MADFRMGIVRFASVANAIADAMGLDKPPMCRVGQARICITFRHFGITTWSDADKIAHALQAAKVARSVLAADSRAGIRARASRAIVVSYEDVASRRGCATEARWEAIVPALATED